MLAFFTPAFWIMMIQINALTIRWSPGAPLADVLWRENRESVFSFDVIITGIINWVSVPFTVCIFFTCIWRSSCVLVQGR